jgi:hypothetical protein
MKRGKLGKLVNIGPGGLAAYMTKDKVMTITREPRKEVAAKCRREDYERYKFIMDDGAMAPVTFDAYESNFKRQVAKMEAELGEKIEVLEFNPDEFVRFCEKHHLKRDSFARCAYATVKATGDLERDFKFVTS